MVRVNSCQSNKMCISGLKKDVYNTRKIEGIMGVYTQYYSKKFLNKVELIKFKCKKNLSITKLLMTFKGKNFYNLIFILIKW